jgi:hypothetical protein
VGCSVNRTAKCRSGHDSRQRQGGSAAAVVNEEFVDLMTADQTCNCDGCEGDHSSTVDISTRLAQSVDGQAKRAQAGQERAAAAAASVPARSATRRTAPTVPAQSAIVCIHLTSFCRPVCVTAVRLEGECTTPPDSVPPRIRC